MKRCGMNENEKAWADHVREHGLGRLKVHLRYDTREDFIGHNIAACRVYAAGRTHSDAQLTISLSEITCKRCLKLAKHRSQFSDSGINP